MTTHVLRGVGAPASPSGLSHRLATWLCALAMLAWAPGAFAHASLISSTPMAGAVLPQAPGTVRLNFNEPVSPLLIKIVQPDGSVRDVAQTHARPAGLEVRLPPLDQQGAYGLSWRVISADGHPVGGALVFSVGSKGVDPVHENAAKPARAILIWLSRLGGYIGLFLGIGMAVCHALAATRRDKRRVAFRLLSLGAAATLLNVGLLGIDALDMPISGLLSVIAWGTGSATAFGLSAALALAALACAAAVWSAAAPLSQRMLAATALGLLGASLAASGHASTAPPAWLARPAIWMHVIAITLWVGSLLPLAHSLNGTTSLNLLKRFSLWIPGALLVLFASGAVLIYLQFDRLSSLWLTAYGQVLALKLALLAALAGLGAYNRYHLTNAVVHGQPRARHAMRRVIYVECLLAVAILAVVALWRFTPPPRALNSMLAASPAISAHIHTGSVMADLSLATSTGKGPATLTLYLSNADLTPLAAQEVDVAFSNGQAGIEPIVFSASRADDGTWRAKNIELPNLPAWRVRIDALVSDFERISLETTLRIEQR